MPKTYYKNGKRKNGMPDGQPNYEIARYVRKILRLRRSNVTVECKILIQGTYHKVLGRAKNASHTTGCQTADVAVTIRQKVLLAINHDGKFHNKRNSQEQDRERDRIYHEAGIPYIVMKTSWLKKEKISAQEYLKMKLLPLKEWIETESNSVSFATFRLWRFMPRMTACAAGSA